MKRHALKINDLEQLTMMDYHCRLTIVDEEVIAGLVPAEKVKTTLVQATSITEEVTPLSIPFEKFSFLSRRLPAPLDARSSIN